MLILLVHNNTLLTVRENTKKASASQVQNTTKELI